MGVGTRQCRVLTVININSDATGVDINCGASNVEQPPNPVRTEHPTRKFTAYSRFMNYSPETGFIYSSRIITDFVQETRFLAIYSIFHVDKVHPSSDRCRETALPCPLSKAMYLTYLKNAVGKPVANR